MKFCPYCGSTLPGSTISFCPECGKPINTRTVVFQPGSDGSVNKSSLINNPLGNQQHPSQSGTEIIMRPLPPPHSQRPPGHYQHIHSGSQTQNKTRPIKRQKHNPPPRPRSDMRKNPDLSRANNIRPNTMDMYYDGYYDDVLTDDDGRTKEKFDSELIKRIALIAIGAAILVVLSIIIMTVL